MVDRLGYFLGIPIELNNIKLYSPTIEEIGLLGELKYNVFVTLASFNKETILRTLYGVNDEDYIIVSNEDAYEVLTSIPSIANEIKHAISYFTKSDVDYDEQYSSYFVDGNLLINKDNYKEFTSIIRKLNGLSEDEQPLKFKNEKAKKLHAKLLKLRSKYKKADDDSPELKDMLSILCNAEGNGINVFNVGKLTIYQVYEHFERLNIKERHTRLLRVWANGYLGKDEKLPEWIVKSKLQINYTRRYNKWLFN